MNPINSVIVEGNISETGSLGNFKYISIKSASVHMLDDVLTAEMLSIKTVMSEKLYFSLDRDKLEIGRAVRIVGRLMSIPNEPIICAEFIEFLSAGPNKYIKEKEVVSDEPKLIPGQQAELF